MTLQFYSDNNSAMARSVWKVLPYSEIDWGEDQGWAWEMLRAGFHKAYIDEACVFHPHGYTPEQRYTRPGSSISWSERYQFATARRFA